MNITRNTAKVVTLWYRAPELLYQSPLYSNKVDVWSVGCIFIQLISGEVLFKSDGQQKQIQLIYEICGDLKMNKWEPKIENKIFQTLKPKKMYPRVFLQHLKKKIPNMPLSYYQLMDSLMQLNPENRLSAEEAMQHQFFKEEPLPCRLDQLPVIKGDYHQHSNKRIRRRKEQFFDPVQKLQSDNAPKPQFKFQEEKPFHHSEKYKSFNNNNSTQYSSSFKRPETDKKQWDRKRHFEFRRDNQFRGKRREDDSGSKYETIYYKQVVKKWHVTRETNIRRKQSAKESQQSYSQGQLKQRKRQRDFTPPMDNLRKMNHS